MTSPKTCYAWKRQTCCAQMLQTLVFHRVQKCLSLVTRHCRMKKQACEHSENALHRLCRMVVLLPEPVVDRDLLCREVYNHPRHP